MIKKYKIKKFRRIKSGYTIIETMIAVSLFIIITTTGIGALLNANLLHEKSSDMRSIMDNLSFIMEDMSRNLRTGSDYYCATGDDDLSSVDTPKSGSSCWGISFSAPPTSQWIYYIGTTSDNGYGIFRSVDGVTVQLTSDEIEIDSVSGFSVWGAEPPPGDTRQPFVSIRLSGKIILKDFVTPFSLQTSVSQRLIDIE